MNHLENYQVFEARYKKKRNLIGKISDFIYGKKDYKELIEDGDKKYRVSSTYKWIRDNRASTIYKSKNDCFYEQVETTSNSTTQVLNFKEHNPDSFLIFGLWSYKVCTLHEKVKLEILISDLIDSIGHELEILSISVDYNTDEEYAEICLKEIGWEEGDSMPDDIYDSYVSKINRKLKKKINKYIQEYNILQSQNNSLKFKKRYTSLYSIRSQQMFIWDKNKGIIKFNIKYTL